MRAVTHTAVMHFDDDRYAAYQLQRCNADQRTFNAPLTILSLVASVLVLFVRLRHKEHRKFPDNAFTAALYECSRSCARSRRR